MALNDVLKFLIAAIEASVHVAPMDSGLTIEELVEIGSRIDMRRGEIIDALNYPASNFAMSAGRVTLHHHLWDIHAGFLFPEEPEMRNMVPRCLEQSPDGTSCHQRQGGAARCNVSGALLDEAFSCVDYRPRARIPCAISHPINIAITAK